jgi:hypothetical protein
MGRFSLPFLELLELTPPNINSRIAEKWGLPFVKNSGAFRKSYIDGRETLRYVCIPLK